jgi:hypothetical protein
MTLQIHAVMQDAKNFDHFLAFRIAGPKHQKVPSRATLPRYVQGVNIAPQFSAQLAPKDLWASTQIRDRCDKRLCIRSGLGRTKIF